MVLWRFLTTSRCAWFSCGVTYGSPWPQPPDLSATCRSFNLQQSVRGQRALNRSRVPRTRQNSLWSYVLKTLAGNPKLFFPKVQELPHVDTLLGLTFVPIVY